MKASLVGRVDALQAQIKPRPEPPELPEWVRWTTCDELMRLEELYRRAEDAGEDEMSESDQHHAMAIYATAMARMLDAPAEARADPAARDAYVREIEDPDKPRWVYP